MVLRTTARALLTALGVGALAATSQLGLAYGLGIVRLSRVFDGPARDQWAAQLAWVTWFAMLSAAAGALVAARTARREIGRSAGATAAIAVAAALGAAVIVPLTMQPARAAQVPGADAVVVVGLCAGIGVGAGMLAGYAAAMYRVVRLGLLAVAGALWLIAIASVAPSLGTSAVLPAVRLGVFDPSFLDPAVRQRFALFTLPAVALVAGAALGWLTRRQRMSQLAVGLSGLAGPATATVAYLVASPGAADQRYQSIPYWAAMVATGTGVLGSVLAAIVRRGDDEPVDEVDADRPEAPAGPPLPLREPGGRPTPVPAGGPAGTTPGWSVPGATVAGGAVAPGAPGRADDPPMSSPPTDGPGPSGGGWLAPMSPARPQRRPVEPPPERQPLQPPPVAPPPVSPLPPQQRAGSGDRPAPGRDDDYVDWVSGLGDKD